MKIFKNKVVLITGHTGFKGGWLSIWLVHLGAKVVGVSNNIVSDPSIFSVLDISDAIDDRRLDVTNAIAMKKVIKEVQPDFVFHLAAQALVRPSYNDPIGTMTTNSIGTACVLDAIRYLDKKIAVVMITSDKVYNNVEWMWGYREIDKLGGKDPYSASKGMAEFAIRSYVKSFFSEHDTNVRIGIARAGNVIGGGDWAIDRIVPDCVRAWSESKTVEIRNPFATRPWQHVLEPLSGYLTLAKKLYLEDSQPQGEAYNFGPSADQNFPVGKLIDEMSKYWDNVRWKDISSNHKHVHEAGLLKLNCEKAFSDLEWHSVLRFEETVKMTVEWYREYYQCGNQSMYDYTISQIDLYEKISKSKKY